MTRLLALLALAAALPACGGTPDEVYPVRAVFVGPRFDGAAARLDHEAVPGLMEAMQMDFRLADSVDVSRVRPGQKVRVQLAVTPEGERVFGVEVLPDSTLLDLAPAAMSRGAAHARS